MPQQITTLKINNFLGIPNADIVFEKPVSLFVGQNNQGKSSIRDALMFAWTGKCRSLTKFKDVKDLSHNGQSGLSVELHYVNGELCVKKRTCSSASSNVEENPAIPFCLNPQLFIDLPSKDRGKLLSDVLGAGLQDLVQEAITEHVGDIPEKILSEIKGSGIDVYDVDALRDEIVNIRRQFKREIKDIPPEAPKLTDYDLPEDYDAANDEEEIKKLAERITKGGELIAQAKEMVMNKAKIIDLKKSIKQNKAKIKPLPEFKGDVDPDKIGKTSVYLTLIEEIKNTAEKNKCWCPICNSHVSVGDLTKRHDALASWLKKFQNQIIERNKITQQNNQLETQIAADTKLLEQLQTSLKEVDIPKNGEKLLEELTSERDKLQANITSYRRFKTDVEVYKEKIERKTSIESLIEECNRIDEALKDGGPVKAAIAAGGKQLPINETLLKVWDMEGLEWADNGEISLNGRAIKYASDSEKYRAAGVMGLALASVSGVGFAALDGFEVLVGKNANGFFDAVEECKLGNVFVFASTTKEYRKVNLPEWLEVFEVENGKVEKL